MLFDLILPPADVLQMSCKSSLETQIFSKVLVTEQNEKVDEGIPDELNSKDTGTTQPKNQKVRINGILKESQLAGIKAGYLERQDEISIKLKSKTYTAILDRTFSFAKLQDGNIIPPVISELDAFSDLAKDRNKQITIRKSWRIISPAKITTTVLSWRNYLIFNQGSVDYRVVSNYYHPLNLVERKAWKSGYCKGYKAGYIQANQQFTSQVSRLQRDFLGMWRFNALVSSGIVEKPLIRENRVGTIVSDKEVFIDRRDLEIVSPAKFNKQKVWKVGD